MIVVISYIFLTPERSTRPQGTLLKIAHSLHSLAGGLQRLHQADPDAGEWLSRLSMKLRLFQTNNNGGSRARDKLHVLIGVYVAY